MGTVEGKGGKAEGCGKEKERFLGADLYGHLKKCDQKIY